MSLENNAARERNLIDRHLPKDAVLTKCVTDGSIQVIVNDLDGGCHVQWFGHSVLTTYHDGRAETHRRDPDESFMEHYGISFADAMALQEVHRLMGEGGQGER